MDRTDARSRTEGRPSQAAPRSRPGGPGTPPARPRPGRHRDSAGVQARRRLAILVTAAALVSAGLGVARAVTGSDEPGTQAASLVRQPARPSSTPTGAASSRSAVPSTTSDTRAASVSSASAGTPTTDTKDRPGSSPQSGSAGPGRSAVPVPERGNGKMTTVQASGRDTTGGRPVTYTIEVEQETGVGPQRAADFIAGVLRHRQGWERLDGIRFVQLTPAERAKGTRPKVRIVLASPATTDRLCAPLSTEGKLSCGTDGRAVLNLRPWLNGTPWHGGPEKAELYRTYLVNHEVGHLIGHGHVGCPKAGDRSPVMLQQTKGLQGCTANPWPSLTRG